MSQRISDRIIYLRSRKGAVVRLVREHYLRLETDIVQDSFSLKERAIEKDTSDTPYIIPGIDVVSDYVELLESAEMKNMIFPQTIMWELKEFSAGHYKRIRKIIADDRHNALVFYNEFFSETWTPKKANELSEDRKRRALFNMLQWLVKHTTVCTVLTTNDKKLHTMCYVEKLPIMNVSDFLSMYYKTSTLNDLYNSLELLVLEKQKNNQNMNDNTISHPVTGFEEYLPMEVLDAGVKSNKYFRGSLAVDKHSPTEAWVRLGSKSVLSRDIFISDETFRNRAIHGDIVVVELLAEKFWVSPTLSLEGVKAKTNGTSSKRIPCGKIIGILASNRRSYVCTLQTEDQQQRHTLLVIPWDSRIPKIRLHTKQAADLFNKRIVARIDEWPCDSFYPIGHYIRQIGTIGTRETEIDVLLYEHEIPTTIFTPHMLADVPAHTPENPWKPPPEEISRRLDLRKSRIMSIDPIGSQDIDDALSAERLSNGNIRIGCHIADVSYFVKEGSLLDVEARSRGTSVYLSDRRIDMLPAILSERVCSLREKEDRFAFSVVWEFHPKSGKIVNTFFGRTIINSIHELNYEQAQRILDLDRSDVEKFGEKEWQLIRNDLEMLRSIFRIINKKRVEEGALELQSVEVKFRLDEKKNPVAASTKPELEVMKMVAEYMILANCCVAQKIWEKFPQNSLLRRHGLPNQSAFEDLVKSAKFFGVIVNTGSNKELSRALKALPRNHPGTFLVKSFGTTAMSEAEYFSTGQYEVAEFYHYGLATPFYTHFTSPIRRYADIIVHRQLQRALEKDVTTVQPYLSDIKLQEIADHINMRNRAAKNVQRDSTGLFHVLFFQLNKNISSDAIIYKMKSNGFLVYISQYGFKGAVYLRDKEGNLIIPENVFSLNPGKYKSDIEVCDFSVDDDNQIMILQTKSQGQVKVSLFDHVTVKINVQDSRAHLPKIKLELVHFGEQKREQKQILPEQPQQEKQGEELRDTMDKKKFHIILSEDEKPFAQSKLRQSLYTLSEMNLSEFILARNPFENLPSKNLGRRLNVKKIGRRTFQEDKLKQMLENQPAFSLDGPPDYEQLSGVGYSKSSNKSSSIGGEGILKPGFYDDDDDEDDEDDYLSPAPQSISSQKQQQQQQQQIAQIKDKFSSEIKGAEKKATVKIIRKIKVIKRAKNS